MWKFLAAEKTLMNLCFSVIPWKVIEMNHYKVRTNKQSYPDRAMSPGTSASKKTFVSMPPRHNASLVESIKYNSIITEINIWKARQMFGYSRNPPYR